MTGLIWRQTYAWQLCVTGTTGAATPTVCMMDNCLPVCNLTRQISIATWYGTGIKAEPDTA